MIIALTGTPGTGKTTVASALENICKVLTVKDLASDVGCITGYDREADSYNIDIPTLRSYVVEYLASRDECIVIEGHLSHFLRPAWSIVLRTKPTVLMKRLKDRMYSDEKVWENVEAEAVDLILIESIEAVGEDHVFEIDTSDASPESTSDRVRGIVEMILSGSSADEIWSEYHCRPGGIDWADDFTTLL